MIVRTWRGSTSLADAERYFEYLKRTGVKQYRRTPGNAGVLVLRREVDGRAEFLPLSLWESMEAVRTFAGADPRQAVFYPEDEHYLVEFDRHVDHYVLLREPEDGPGSLGDPRARFVYLWRYQPRVGREAAFENLYGPHGDWARFFGRSPAQLGTELLRSTESSRYVTVDSWSSREAHGSFVKQNREAWLELDARGEALTAAEEPLGEFTVLREDG